MPSPVSPTFAAGQRGERRSDAAARPADVVAVHHPDQRAVRVAVEALDQLVALVVEVGVDREPAVRLAGAAEPAVEVGLRSIGGHGQLAGEREALVAEPVHELELDVVPRDRHRARRRRGGDRDDVIDARRALERDLERDHPAQRAAGDDGPAVDAEGVGEGPQGPGLVAGGDGGEPRSVGPAGDRVDRRGSRRAVAAAEQVRAQDADGVRVEGAARGR